MADFKAHEITWGGLSNHFHDSLTFGVNAVLGYLTFNLSHLNKEKKMKIVDPMT